MHHAPFCGYAVFLKKNRTGSSIFSLHGKEESR
jgi:hypothetical protein